MIRSPKSFCRNPSAANVQIEKNVFTATSKNISSLLVQLLKEKTNPKMPSPIGLIQANPHSILTYDFEAEQNKTDRDFKPFISEGSVSLLGQEKPDPVTILRDAGA